MLDAVPRIAPHPGGRAGGVAVHHEVFDLSLSLDALSIDSAHAHDLLARGPWPGAKDGEVNAASDVGTALAPAVPAQHVSAGGIALTQREPADEPAVRRIDVEIDAHFLRQLEQERRAVEERIGHRALELEPQRPVVVDVRRLANRENVAGTHPDDVAVCIPRDDRQRARPRARAVRDPVELAVVGRLLRDRADWLALAVADIDADVMRGTIHRR